MKSKVFNLKSFFVIIFLLLSLFLISSLNLRSDVKNFDYFKIALNANEEFKIDAKENLATVYLYSNERVRNTVLISKELYKQSLYFLGVYTNTIVKSVKKLRG